jgi:TrmH family RNA methyltransferase
VVDLASVRNPAVTDARRLARQRERDADRLLVEAPGPVTSAVAAGACVDLYATPEAAHRHERLLTDARSAGARVRTVAPAALEAMAATRTPQGVVAVARWPLAEPGEALSQATLAVVAVGCADPGNVGTLVRTADAAGADAVVAVGGADPRGPKAVRASAGSLFHLPVADATWDDAARAAAEADLALVATRADAVTTHHQRDWTRPAAVVLGGEAHGLAAEISAGCDEAVGVPIVGRAESLNVAVTGAVVLYEAVRQRAASAAGLAERRP